MMRNSWLTIGRVAVGFAAFLPGFYACGGDDASDRPAPPVPCVVDGECDDDNPCTVDSCGEEKFCVAEKAPDGESLDQTVGDCAVTVCTDGKASQEPDSGDVDDDKEPCTLDVCRDGKPSHVAQMDGTHCDQGLGNGSCLNGTCWVLCTASNADTQCDDLNPCTQDACVPCAQAVCGDNGRCDHSGLSGMQTPGAPQVEGDCHERRCVEGEDTDAIDNYDTPDDASECTKGVCKSGVPVNQPQAIGEPCDGDTGVCDEDGACVDCLTASDCNSTAPSTCYQPACESGYCTTEPSPEGTALPAGSQQKGDCQKRVCDGAGSYSSEPDATDTPDDGNPCTTDLCDNAYPSHDYLPAGTPCGTNRVCDGSGSCCTPVTCQDYSLECGTTSNGCGGTLDCGACPNNGVCQYNHCCTPTTCAAASRECGTTSDGCGGTLDCGTCPGTTDVCLSWGDCCTPKTCAGEGQSCDTLADGCGEYLDCGTCDPGDYCSGGTCQCKNGIKDYGEADIDCGGQCSTPCAAGKTCTSGADCATGACVDGVCCLSACTGTCKACSQALTGVANGTCANVTDGTDPGNECTAEPAASCGATGMCKAGACETASQGTVCAASSCTAGVETRADTCNGSGTCVDNGTVSCVAPYSCGASRCQSCSDGLKNGNETDVDCGGGGACQPCIQGKLCLAGSDCGTGLCVDGRCCADACAGLCQACNVTGNVGICTNIPSGQDPDNECAGPKTCTGSGSCN